MGVVAGRRELADVVGAERCWRDQKVMDSFEECNKKANPELLSTHICIAAAAIGLFPVRSVM